MKNLCIILLFLLVWSPAQIQSRKNKRKAVKTTTESPEETTLQPAIIAIEIVDPNENSTSVKNSKRTIESALGYGYNSYEKPRYEVYKYSQHDIPGYKGDSFKSSPTTPFSVQKSVQYTLPTVTEQIHTIPSVLAPGTTLYSSLSAKGQVGGLTSSLSQISELQNTQSPLPVIVLRIYPDQLKDSTIQANLPENHPFSKKINSINIQSLLNHYINAIQPPASVSQYSTNTGYVSPSRNVYSTSQPYTATAQKAQYNRYETPNYFTHTGYQVPATYQSNSASQYYQPGYKQQSYQQSYEQPQQYSDYNGVQLQEAPIKYQFKYESPTTQVKHVPKKPEPQFYYVQPTTQSSYSTPTSQYYQPTQQADYSNQLVQAAAPQSQHYLPANDQQYADYEAEQPQQYVATSPKLLTEENYPTDKHTRVVFRTATGNVRTPEEDSTTPKEVKTINIQVPDNIAKVEVQETEKPYYGYQNSYASDQSNEPYAEPLRSYSKLKNADNYYVTRDTVRQDYYNADDTPEDGGYNYQNIDYEQMAKYFVRRGAMPRDFYQQPADAEDADVDNGRSNQDDLAAAYEEAAFPSTTTEPSEMKKTKTKKRT
ncbi:uncharacterized protein LOC109538199 [Dendroctonus ponderosae]|uniref:uncharacterized protein LOC109538199 n=1 Tax=Dendroctonus ponderosae TaxID=77166 RepID=UPI002035406B|nr:uncharacterized protein LOC109538199 [Dendroctonus ponderosae]KAH1024965.1 hypothetical protein HUJ05_009786 [Dendroctonus ponderosae]